MIQNQHFSNESSLAEYIEWDALARISFVNCKFNNLSLRKCQFSNCNFKNFKNCQIVKSDLSRAQFNDSSFGNCEFLKSDFDSCKLKRTTFFKSNLALILVEDVKVWESK